MAKKEQISDLVKNRLNAEEQMHFNYHKLYLNGIDLNNATEIDEFLRAEYLEGLSPEEFAMQFIITKIQSDIQKISQKFPVKKPSKKSKEKLAGTPTEMV